MGREGFVRYVCLEGGGFRVGSAGAERERECAQVLCSI